MCGSVRARVCVCVCACVCVLVCLFIYCLLRYQTCYIQLLVLVYMYSEEQNKNLDSCVWQTFCALDAAPGNPRHTCAGAPSPHGGDTPRPVKAVMPKEKTLRARRGCKVGRQRRAQRRRGPLSPPPTQLGGSSSCLKGGGLLPLWSGWVVGPSSLAGPQRQ